MKYIEAADSPLALPTIELTRRNLEILLAKLDDPLSVRSIAKDGYAVRAVENDGHAVVAVENAEHYSDRAPWCDVHAQQRGVSVTSKRKMPPMPKIIEWWKTHPEPRLKSCDIGWGEPFCFGCGWLAPVNDGRRISWDMAKSWLDRAHLQDHALHGPDEPFNLVPLCHLCHFEMPQFGSRPEALEWVIRLPQREAWFQLFTDEIFRDRTDRPNRHTTLLRARTKYLEALRKVSDESCQNVPAAPTRTASQRCAS